MFGRENNRLITFEQSLPELAGKKHALSFRPATQADEDLINSYLPDPDPNTGEIDPSQLPNSLPGYLINLTAEFTQNGEVIHSAAAGTMGGELYETLALWSPTEGWDQAVNHPIAGEYRAIGLDLQGANPEEAARLRASVENTRDILQSEENSLIDALTPEKVIGSLFYSTIYTYLSLTNLQDNIQAQSVGIVNYRMPSYGVFSMSLQTSYWFGLPRNVNFSGLFIDVDRLASQSTDKLNNLDKRNAFIKASGFRASAMEHEVPQIIFAEEDNSVEGISAVKAISLAASEGQRIWEIRPENLNVALEAITLGPEIENEIRNSVLAGNIVTTHESPIDFINNRNVGYLSIDPLTGAGAYKIAGGLNGGLLEGVKSIIQWLGWGLSYKAGLLGVSPNPVTPYFVVAWTTINAIQIAYSCSDGVARALAMTAFLSAVIIMTFIGTLLAFPVSLIGAVAAFYLLGFTRNWLIDYC